METNNTLTRCTTSPTVAVVTARQVFWKNYSGYLHADAYTGYDAMFLDVGSGVIEVACWAHARRKFFDAVKSYPREVAPGAGVDSAIV